MIEKLVYRFVSECKKSTHADTESEAKTNLKKVLDAVKGFQTAFKLQQCIIDPSREINDSPGGSRYKFIYTFKFEARGDSDIYTDLPRAFKHFCNLHLMEGARQELYLQEEDL